MTYIYQNSQNCTMHRVNSNVNNRLVNNKDGFINYNKGTTLMQDVKIETAREDKGYM